LNASTAGKRCRPRLTQIPLKAGYLGVAYEGLSLCNL
jgi:hypothetical protein